jgi:hypothetical protein
MIRDTSGNGGYCLFRAPVALGPWRAFGPANAQSGALRSLMAWAMIHRPTWWHARGTAVGRDARRRMRVCARMWRRAQ